jgi:hypothetical protein
VLAEEVEALTAIYGGGGAECGEAELGDRLEEKAQNGVVLSIRVGGSDSTASRSNNDDTQRVWLRLRLPLETGEHERQEESKKDGRVAFVMGFDAEYPVTAPWVEVKSATVGGEEERQLVAVVEDVIGRVWMSGKVCVFDLIEEVGEIWEQRTTAKRARIRELQLQLELEMEEQDQEQIPDESEDGDGPTAKDGSGVSQRRGGTLTTDLEWTVSEPMTEKKSVFIARCAAITPGSDTASSLLTHLLSTNKKVAAATHNIAAWRIRNGDGPVAGTPVQDYDDDGETAAGGRLLRLMQLMDVWDVIVVVSRWYGGVKLGPDRFRLINQAARQVLIQADFGEPDEVRSQKRNKKNGRR